MAKKHHPFTHTHIEHHADGSHTVHHVHKDGPHKDVKAAAVDHDGMLDHVMDNTSAPNPGEPEQAAPGAGAPAAAGMPMAGAPAQA
jgi:hypothetical protein